MKTLDQMENVFGKVSPEIKNRIINYLDNPTIDNWDEISSIIVTSNFKTVWQSLLEIDPTFPRRGRAYDEDDNIIREWERIPSPFEVVKAISDVV